MDGTVKMDGELLLPGDQLQGKKTLNTTEGGENLSWLRKLFKHHHKHIIESWISVGWEAS